MLKDKRLFVAIAVAAFAVLTAGWSLVSQKSSGKTGYILIGQVMQNFEMKKEKERRLQDIGIERKKYLDSLKFSIDNFFIAGSPKNKLKLDSLKYLYDL